MPKIAKQIEHMYAEENAGRPFPIIDHCFPTGMPSYMLITHNAFEILFTPGRVTLLGEGDGNRLRRIYTDGRPHPDDPDPSFHGHSIGHWERANAGRGYHRAAAAGLSCRQRSGGRSQQRRHAHRRAPPSVESPTPSPTIWKSRADKLLSKPWNTTRKYYRQRAQKYDIVEGVCAQGSFNDAVDKNGNAIFAPIKFHNGVPVGSDSK